MTLASRIDRVLVGGGSDDILLKTYPTFALNKVTVAGPRARSTSSMARISSAIPDTHTRC